jgi:hypothetical protein
MTEQSTIHYERTSPQVAKITFANLPVNLIDEFATDPDIQVVVFDSSVPDFFYNHSTSPQPPTSPPPKARERCRSGPTWC